MARADAPHTRRTSALIHRSFFRPLTRVRYELVGQDRAIEQLFRVLSIHSRQLSATPLVVLLCGPSGHGKSLLARKCKWIVDLLWGKWEIDRIFEFLLSCCYDIVGALLDVPTHTVNMTTLRSTQDLWKSYSMSPYEVGIPYLRSEWVIDSSFGRRQLRAHLQSS